jgi:hypothetical protein
MKTLMTVSAVFLVGAAGVPTPVKADQVIQNPGANFIAFEAELSGTISNGAAPGNVFVNIDDAGASGGGALFTSNATANYNAGSTPTSFDTFSLTFATPGSYTLYYTVKSAAESVALDAFAGNSFRLASTFGGPIDTTSASNGQGNLTSYTFFSEPVAYVVNAPGTFNFQIGDREAGTTIDRFIFSSAPIADKAAFDALPNSIPEPTALLSLLAGAAMLTSGRLQRRGRSVGSALSQASQ